MLARPTNPLASTALDLRFRNAVPKNDQLFEGWGIPISGTKV
jgi:hypothetical protein